MKHFFFVKEKQFTVCLENHKKSQSYVFEKEKKGIETKAVSFAGWTLNK